MLFQCDDASTNKPCESCAKAHAASLLLYPALVKFYKDAGLTPGQGIQTAIIAALTMAEVTAGKPNLEIASAVVGQIVGDWLNRIADASTLSETQDSELKSDSRKVNVANVITGNRTVN